MRKAVLAGVFAVVTLGSSAVLPGLAGQAHAQGVVITEGHIATLKAALNLTPAQERHWGPVEHALRALARQSSAGEDEQSEGWMQRTRRKVASVGASAAGLRRVMASARPLIRTLDSEQKQHAIALARSLGIHSIASAL